MLSSYSSSIAAGACCRCFSYALAPVEELEDGVVDQLLKALSACEFLSLVVHFVRARFPLYMRHNLLRHSLLAAACYCGCVQLVALMKLQCSALLMYLNTDGVPW